MTRRQATRGPNRGGYFYGCTTYPRCRYTENDDPRTAAGAQTAHETTADRPSSDQRQSLPRVLEWAIPSGVTGAARSFVPGAGRRGVRDEPERPPAFTHACIAWPAGEGTGLANDPAAQTVLHVAERVLRRGVCPPLPLSAQRRLGEASDVLWTGPNGRSAWRSPDGSQQESQFLNLLALDVMGQTLLPFLHAQVPFSALVGDEDVAAQRRVDFAVFHPAQRCRALVIEVDGLQHRDEQAQAEDRRRDELLRAAGHDVVRVLATEVRDGNGAGLERLRAAVRGFPDLPSADVEALACAQAMSTLIESVRRGILRPDATAWSIRPAGAQSHAIRVGIEEAVALLRYVEELYGTRIAPGDLRVVSQSAPADVELLFEPVTPWFCEVADRSEDGVPRITIRPTYLPGITPLRPPPLQYVSPREAVSADALRGLLRFVFPGKDDFWPGQEEGVRRCLLGVDCLVLLPTGGGKSLIYQLAATLLPGLTLVVAPLVSLMVDQIDNLNRAGFDRVAAISSITTAGGETQAIQEMLGDGSLFILYVAPERLQIQEFRSALVTVRMHMPIPLIVVDEAHCVSEWGHDFRTSYLNLGRLGRKLGRRDVNEPPAVVGLTGTASRSVLRDVQRELGIYDFDAVITPESFDRAELTFEVRKVHSQDKLQALLGVLRALPQRLPLDSSMMFRPRGDETSAGIVFCPHVRGQYGVLRVAEQLQGHTRGEVPSYSSNLNPDERAVVGRRFKTNDFPLLVATKAFGMGIDKPNVRYTVHYGLPASLEAFYQEAGRAGRDRRPAHCVVLASVDDAGRAGRALDPGLGVADVAHLQDRAGYRDGDDVTRALYFHVHSFRGAEAEVEIVARLLQSLGDLRSRGRDSVVWRTNDERADSEKALHRLEILGVVHDYTVEYAQSSFTVYREAVTAEVVENSLSEYVGAYSAARAGDVVRRGRELRHADSLEDAVLGYARSLAQYVYETVELARRAAIREVWRWSELGTDSERLRRRLLDYLQETEFSKELFAILAGAGFNLDRWAALLDSVRSRRDVDELDAAMARALEDYPDHPVLLVSRGIVGAWLREPADEVASRIRAGLEYLTARYSGASRREDLARWTLAVLRRRAGVPWKRILPSVLKQDDGALCKWVVREDFPRYARVATAPRALELLRESTAALAALVSTGDSDV